MIQNSQTVTRLALPGCHSFGSTLEAAGINVREATEGYLQILTTHNKSIPTEESVTFFLKKTRICNGFNVNRLLAIKPKKFDFFLVQMDIKWALLDINGYFH